MLLWLYPVSFYSSVKMWLSVQKSAAAVPLFSPVFLSTFFYVCSSLWSAKVLKIVLYKRYTTWFVVLGASSFWRYFFQRGNYSVEGAAIWISNIVHSTAMITCSRVSIVKFSECWSTKLLETKWKSFWAFLILFNDPFMSATESRSAEDS